MNLFWKIIQWVLDKMKIIGAACLVGMTFLTCADAGSYTHLTLPTI